MGIFSRINKGLKKTRENMSGAIDSMLHGKTEIDDEFMTSSKRYSSWAMSAA